MDISPRVGDRNRADFLASADAQDGIFIEVASVSDVSNAGRAEGARLSDVYDALNRVDCPDYFLNLVSHGVLDSPLPGDSLRLKLRQFIDSLNYEEVRLLAKGGLTALPKFEFQHGRFTLEVSIIPVSPARRGLVGRRPVGMTGPGKFRIVDNTTSIKKKVRQKARQHRQVRAPLLVAINAAGRHVEHMDMMEILFGQEIVVFPEGQQEPIETRSPNGALVGPRGPQNRNISAVLIVSSLLPWKVTTTVPIIYHNPWAANPINPISAFPAEYLADGEKVVYHEGKPIHQVLNLPQDWPYFDDEREDRGARNTPG